MKINIKLLLIGFVGICIVIFSYLSFFAGSGSSTFDRNSAANDVSSFSFYERAQVINVLDESIEDFGGNQLVYQYLEVLLLSGDQKGKLVALESSGIVELNSSNIYKAGDKVVLGGFGEQTPQLSESDTEGELIAPVNTQYVIVDHYRTSGLYVVIALFVIIAIVTGRRQGAMSLVGLFLTGLVLLLFIAPQILMGKNPVLIALCGSMVIALVTMFISHGYNIRTQLSVISTLTTLFVTAALSYLFVSGAQLFGLGQNEAFILETGFIGLDMRGILLASILIAVLGVLDDVTTTQTAAIEELHEVDKNISSKELFARGMSIGKEHIASLINTLILVYAGSSLPLFLLLTSATDQPLWVLLNSEYMAEEIIRAISGSVGLILAVPISTFIAVKYYKQQLPSEINTESK